MDVKALITNKGLGYWICAAASVFALVLAIIVFATNFDALPNTVSNGWAIGLVLLIGVVVQIAVTFFPIRFASAVSVIVYTIAFGVTANKIPNAIADHFNQVNYTGGDFGMCMFYAVAALVITLACVVACFFKQTKDGTAVV